jgi:hypothetical protein
MDRRRAERFEILVPLLATLTLVTPEVSTTHQVELLELASSGALLATVEALEAGQGGWLSASLEGYSFSARVDLLRVETAARADGRELRLVALKFAGVSGRDLVVLRRFLGV